MNITSPQQLDYILGELQKRGASREEMQIVVNEFRQNRGSVSDEEGGEPSVMERMKSQNALQGAASAALGRPLSEEGMAQVQRIPNYVSMTKKQEAQKQGLSPEEIGQMDESQLDQYIGEKKLAKGLHPITQNFGEVAAAGAKGLGRGVLAAAKGGANLLGNVTSGIASLFGQDEAAQQIQSSQQKSDEFMQENVAPKLQDTSESFAGKAIGKIAEIVGEEAIPFLASGGLAKLASAGFIKLAPKAAKLIGAGADAVLGGTGAKVASVASKALVNPIVKGAAEGAAVLPAYKAMTGENPTGGDVIGGAIGGAAIEGALKVASPAIKYFTTPKAIKEVEAANKEIFKAVKPRLTEKRALNTVKSNYQRGANVLVREGYKPTDVESFAKSIEDAKAKVWSQVEAKIGGGEGLRVDFKGIANDLEKMVNKPAFKISDSTAVDKIKDLAQRLRKVKSLGVADAEQLKELLNADLQGAFGTFNFSEIEKNAKKLMTSEIGKQLDDLLSKIPSEFANLKKDWGALQSMYPDVYKRYIVFARQNPETLFEGLGKLSGVGDILGGLVKFNPSQIAQGAGKITMGQYLKRRNDANLLVKKAFEKLYGNLDKSLFLKGLAQ